MAIAAQILLSGTLARLLPTVRLGSADPARRQVDLLVTALVMPQMNGLDLANRIMAAHRKTRVLYLTGYAT